MSSKTVAPQGAGAGHNWTFFRAGGLDQIRLETAADLKALPELDQKLWVALSCPTRGLEFDSKTLDLIDCEKDGRIRAPEILAAVKWAAELLKNPADLARGEAELPLSAINDATDAGKQILASARRILVNLGKSGAAAISVDDTTDTTRIFAQTQFNGDGIIPVASAPDEETKKVIEDIIVTLGGEADRSGALGVSQSRVDQFFLEIQAYSDWWAKARGDATIMILGEATPAAFEALKAVRAKIDDYFARCKLATFDARAMSAMNRSESEYAAIAVKNLAVYGEEVAGLPLNRIGSEQSLSLTGGINPAWAGAIEAFHREVVTPLLGAKKESITDAEWDVLTGRFAAYAAWLAGKPVTLAEKLSLERMRSILAGNAKEAIGKLIQEDARWEAESNQIASVDRLVRYYRDLHKLLRNFVNFSDFYNPAVPAIFQTGRLYLDGRACDLCIAVEDIGKHATLAANGRVYLAYCELTRPATGQKRLVCAAFTAGFAESLWVGRNGIFYDREGKDWDAVVVKVVEHSISLKEAFWAPWKKIAKMISDQINKLLAAREQAALVTANKSVEETAKSVETAKPAAPAPATGNAMGGAALASSVAAIGIAVGLLGQAVGGLFTVVSGLPPWKTVLGVLAVILAVSGPSVIIAYFKLRARDLGPILNACGWAINSRVKLTLKLGQLLTQEAQVPVTAGIMDPYAEDNRKRNWVVAAVVVIILFYVACEMGLLDWVYWLVQKFANS